jgi:hypothetical protein
MDLDGLPRVPLQATTDIEVSVMIFITTDCPIANGYTPQIQALIASYKDKPVRFCLVHVDPEVSAEDARIHAEDYGHTGSILLDPKHLLVKAAGATNTPDAAVFLGETLQYCGRINDWYGDLGRKRPQPTTRDLADAIDAVLAGDPVATPWPPAVGCAIADLR